MYAVDAFNKDIINFLIKEGIVCREEDSTVLVDKESMLSYKERGGLDEGDVCLYILYKIRSKFGKPNININYTSRTSKEWCISVFVK